MITTNDHKQALKEIGGFFLKKKLTDKDLTLDLMKQIGYSMKCTNHELEENYEEFWKEWENVITDNIIKKSIKIRYPLYKGYVINCKDEYGDDIFAYIEDEKVLGIIIYYKNFLDNGKTFSFGGEIGIYVHPFYKRRKIGTLLLLCCLKVNPEIKLENQLWSEEGIKFYNKIKYYEYGRYNHFNA